MVWWLNGKLRKLSGRRRAFGSEHSQSNRGWSGQAPLAAGQRLRKVLSHATLGTSGRVTLTGKSKVEGESSDAGGCGNVGDEPDPMPRSDSAESTGAFCKPGGNLPSEEHQKRALSSPEVEQQDTRPHPAVARTSPINVFAPLRAEQHPEVRTCDRLCSRKLHPKRWRSSRAPCRTALFCLIRLR